MAEWVSQRGQVALLIIVKLPAFAGRQDTFDKLPVFVITVSKGIAGRQLHFGQCPIRVVIEGGDPTCGIGFPDDLAMAPLAAGDAPQRIDFTDHQPIMIVVMLGFATFGVRIGSNTRLIIIAEPITPVTAGRRHTDHPSLCIISEMQISLIGIVPAGHAPLHIIFMPQMVVLERLTFTQIALRIIVAGDQPLLFLLIKIIHGLELLSLITQHQPETICARGFDQLRLLIIDKADRILTAIRDRGQLTKRSGSVIKMVSELGLAIGELQFAA
ncbi:hypothetical protein Xenpb_00976 [Xenorhabdus sp. PB62.4]|nr:hypothetical protein [Xenorhabdus sp. PB62.4]